MKSSSRNRIALTLTVGAGGASAFVLLDLPLPLLLGPMVACLIVALTGAKLRGMGKFGTFMRTFLGVAVGSSITPEVVGQLPSYWVTLAFIPLFLLVIGFAGYPILRRVFGMDHATAYYATMPGGLQDMLLFGEEAGGDVRALSLIHATRVLVIVTLAPFLLHLFWQVDLTQPPGAPASDMNPFEIVLMILCGVVGWKLAERVRLFGASILGPLILTAIFTLSGVLTHRPPAEFIWAAQFFIGIEIGVKYVGITGRELRHFVLAGLVFSLVLALIHSGLSRLRDMRIDLVANDGRRQTQLCDCRGADTGNTTKFVVGHIVKLKKHFNIYITRVKLRARRHMQRSVKETHRVVDSYLSDERAKALVVYAKFT